MLPVWKYIYRMMDFKIFIFLTVILIYSNLIRHRETMHLKNVTRVTGTKTLLELGKMPNFS